MTDAARDTVRGRFITLEGGEGTGKSTQAAKLASRLRAQGFDVVETREPGGTPGAEMIRHAVLSGHVTEFGPFAEALLMNAARDDHLTQVIRPALEAGRWVVCDRFADSTLAYQGALGGLDVDVLATLEDAVVSDTRPDLTVVLDIDPRTGLERARAASRAAGEDADRFEDLDLAGHDLLRKAFLAIAESEPERCVVVAADGTVEEVTAAIWDCVVARLPVAEIAASHTST